LFDFTIRIFINPRYAPSLIIGQWIVRHQQPEYVGAPQKRFAWTIGFALALAMLYLLVINHVIGPINLIVCSACLILLFFESAFGICIGCKIYNLFNREKAQLCPGGACEIPAAKNSGLSLLQIGTLALFIVLIGVTSQWVYRTDNQNQRHEVQNNLPAPTAAAAAVDPAEVERCKVPDFAKAMGHEEKWKLHNNCK
jgi:cbb3-type cytochrome oxidase subunit 3